MTRALTHGTLAAYGALSIPLSMAALPVYVHVPKFYTETLGLNLSLVGVILLVTRLLDALQDPLLGWWSDRHVGRGGTRRFFITLGVPLLAIGFLLTFMPPSNAGAAWLAIALVVTYFAFSVLTVNYQALGSELSFDAVQRTRVTAWREGLALAGVVAASAAPTVLAQQYGAANGYARFAMVFAGVLLFCALITWRYTPLPVHAPAQATSPIDSVRIPFTNTSFRWLLVIFVFNGVAASVPATLVLFFIHDVVGARALEAHFLIAYFLAGALGLPGWVWLSARLGKGRAWALGMVVAIAAFIWAAFLQPGDVVPYFIICALSGLALGADLALPPSILADVIDRDEARGLPRSEGAYFGLWALVTKLNLAVAAGVALPLLQALGYSAGGGSTSNNLTALAVVYAAVPCALKLIALAVLMRSPIAAPILKGS